MGLDIYISKKTDTQEECLIHWNKFYPIAEWFKATVYGGKLDRGERELDYLMLVSLHDNCALVLNSGDWKAKMGELLFPINSSFEWTGRRELAYLKMMETVVEDVEDLSRPESGDKLLIQISY